MILSLCICFFSFSIIILDQAVIIRYEDLCKKPQQTADRLMNFLKLKKHEAIEHFIKTHSYSNVEPTSKNNFKTTRNSSYMAFEWRKHLGNNDIASIQQSCENSMNLLGYNKMLNIKSDKLNENYPITRDNPFIE